MENKLRILPIGGCGEIGLNINLLQVDDKYFFIDCGFLYPNVSLIGVDAIIPNLEWLLEQNISPSAWIITHGHEDHMGALIWWYKHFKAPIIATPFTIELIKLKFSDANLPFPEFQILQDKGCFIEKIIITPIHATHSICQACGILIETDWGNIFHTGDFKIDLTDSNNVYETLTKTLTQPIKLLMADSTNVFEKGSNLQEKDLFNTFTNLIGETSGLIIFIAFASNVERFKTIIEACLIQKRKVAFLGKTIKRNLEIALDLGLIPDYSSVFIDLNTGLKEYNRNEICILCTGSQGENFSGATRLAADEVEGLQMQPEDTVVFSSSVIPGNEKNVAWVINMLSGRNCKIVTNVDKRVHVSGHAKQEELQALYNIFKPEYYLPIHGEYRHLKKHQHLVQQWGLQSEKCLFAGNGQWVNLYPLVYVETEKLSLKRYYVCQNSLLDPASDTYRARLSMAKNGIIAVFYCVKKEIYSLISEPSILIKGVPISDEFVKDKASKLYTKIYLAGFYDKGFKLEKLAEELRLTLRKEIEKIIKYKCNLNIIIKEL